MNTKIVITSETQGYLLEAWDGEEVATLHRLSVIEESLETFITDFQCPIKNHLIPLKGVLFKIETSGFYVFIPQPDSIDPT